MDQVIKSIVPYRIIPTKAIFYNSFNSASKFLMSKITCIYISQISWFQAINTEIISLDTPESGSGDHENVYGVYNETLEIYDSDGNLYGECERKAVNIREISKQRPWHSFENNTILFSDLSRSMKKYLSMDSKEDINEAKNSVRYTKAVKSSYG